MRNELSMVVYKMRLDLNRIYDELNKNDRVLPSEAQYIRAAMMKLTLLENEMVKRQDELDEKEARYASYAV